jgi:predicted outer membrane protein
MSLRLPTTTPLVLGAALTAQILVAGAARAAIPPKLAAHYTPPPEPRTDVTETPLSYAGLSPAAIASALVAANDGEIEQALIALSRSTSPAVVAYARHILVDRERESRNLLALSMGREPPETGLSRQIENEARGRSALLLRLAGPAFDAVYVNIQILAHTRALRFVDGGIGSMAAIPAFVRLLSNERGMIRRHLDLAIALRG